MPDQLELYDRDGTLTRAIAPTRDDRNETKCILAEPVSLGAGGGGVGRAAPW
jgi:hypothetical protein